MLEKTWVRNLIIFGAVVLCFILLFLMKEVVVPICIALTIGYLGDPVIDQLEKWKISRTWGIVILITVMVLLLFGVVIYVVPKLAFQLRELAMNLGGYWETFQERLLPEVKAYADEHPEEVAEIKESAMAWLQENAGMLATNITASLAVSFRSAGAFLANILGLVIIPVLAFYFLRDFDIMKEQAARLIPVKRREYVIALFSDFDQALGSFIKGQLLVAIILSIIYSIGLTIAGCPASLLIGVVAGFANLIPYLGIALGFVPAVILTWVTGNPMWQVIVAALTFVVGQMLEGMVITPKVVGESVGLHPVVVLVALMVGGGYFGFVGMVLALPASAVLMVVLKRAWAYYTSSILYHEGIPVSESPIEEVKNDAPDGV